MKQLFVRSSYILASLAGMAGLFAYRNLPEPPLKKNTVADAIKLPAGFSATVLGTELGATRHLTVSKNGDVYAKLSKLKDGKGILLMRDTNKDGVIDETKYFGNYPGTGVTIKNGYLYASSNTGVMRYKLNANEEIIDIENPEKIVDGLVDKGRDNAKPFVLDNANNIYVTVGSYNDPCREKGTGKGIMPCSILDSAGGIWKFKFAALYKPLKPINVLLKDSLVKEMKSVFTDVSFTILKLPFFNPLPVISTILIFTPLDPTSIPAYMFAPCKLGLILFWADKE
jgi:hypothetical protein